MTYDGYKARSLLEFPGARETVIEFHSLSKTYNMTAGVSAGQAGTRS